MSSVEALLKRNSPGAFFNTIFSLFSRVIGGTMREICCSMFCGKLSCCRHRAILGVRGRELWAWCKNALVKSCGAIYSRGDLIRGNVGIDRRCLCPMKAITCFIWSGWTSLFLLLLWGCGWFGKFADAWLPELLTEFLLQLMILCIILNWLYFCLS